jgi:hypothetical protein
MRVERIDENTVAFGPFGYHLVSGFDDYSIYKQVDVIDQNFIIVRDSDLEIVRMFSSKRHSDLVVVQ